MTNLIHDFTYYHAFAKQKFDIQSRNFKEGWKGNDRVWLSVNDASDMSNAVAARVRRLSCRFFTIPIANNVLSQSSNIGGICLWFSSRVSTLPTWNFYNADIHLPSVQQRRALVHLGLVHKMTYSVDNRMTKGDWNRDLLS